MKCIKRWENFVRMYRRRIGRRVLHTVFLPVPLCIRTSRSTVKILYVYVHGRARAVLLFKTSETNPAQFFTFPVRRDDIRGINVRAPNEKGLKTRTRTVRNAILVRENLIKITEYKRR